MKKGRTISEKKRTISVILSEDDYIGLEALMYQYRRRSMSSFVRDIVRTLFMHIVFRADGCADENGMVREDFFKSVGIDMNEPWSKQNPELVSTYADYLKE